MKTSNLISVSAYAKAKGCKPTYIFRMIREGKLKHVIVAGKICIDKDVVILTTRKPKAK